MRESALAVGSVARYPSGDGDPLPVVVVVERTGLLGLIEERGGFHGDMGPVIGVRVRLHAPLPDRLELILAVPPHLAQIFGRECFRFTPPRRVSQLSAPCPADRFK